MGGGTHFNFLVKNSNPYKYKTFYVRGPCEYFTKIDQKFLVRAHSERIDTAIALSSAHNI